MKTWLDKICSVLETPKYKNTKYCWVDINYKTNKITSCCALGELFLRAKGKSREARSFSITKILQDTYKVPSEYVNTVFETINKSNIAGLTKRSIAKFIKQEFKGIA